MIDIQKYRKHRRFYPIEYTSDDVVNYQHDVSLLDDFPLPSVLECEGGLGGGSEGKGEGEVEGEGELKGKGEDKTKGELRKHLKYIPWEDHIKSMNQNDIPLAIPDEWDPTVRDDERGDRTYWGRFPLSE